MRITSNELKCGQGALNCGQNELNMRNNHINNIINIVYYRTYNDNCTIERSAL